MGCERPGCDRPAGAAFAVDPRRLIVWIGDLETSAAGINRLCGDCADRLAAPRGWERRDIRDTPRLFAVTPVEPTTAPVASSTPAPATTTVADTPATTTPAVTPTTVAPRRRRSSRSRIDATLNASFLDGSGPGTGSTVDRAPAPMSGQRPVGAEAMLDPSAATPLLARAFRGARVAG